MNLITDVIAKYQVTKVFLIEKFQVDIWHKNNYA